MARLKGNKKNNTLSGQKADDTILGLDGDDVLFGGAGDDKIDGGKGSDTLIDGAGKDKLTGGAGRDTFLMSSDGKTDSITDFEQDIDKIDLSALGVEKMKAVKVKAREDGVLIKTGGESILVKGAKKSDFGADDFIFKDEKVIDFDELAAENESEGSVGNEEREYEGFTWFNWGFIETDETDNVSGYKATSGDNVVYNTGGRPSVLFRDEPFDFEAIELGAAWRDELQVAITAYFGDDLLGTQILSASTDGLVSRDLDDKLFDHVTRVEIATYAGKTQPDTEFDWVQYAIDDLVLVG